MLGKIGGDSSLSPRGEAYALKLADYARDVILKDPENPRAWRTRLWTSTLRRTRQTARHIKHDVVNGGWVTMRPRQWRALDELFAGVFDGMTYEDIKRAAPDEFSMRQDAKLTYRYPRGESYLDVITRVEPIVQELERQVDPVLIVGHQGILRVIIAYFTGLDREMTPFIKVNLDTVTKLQPTAYGCKKDVVKLQEYGDDSDDSPPTDRKSVV